MQESIKVAETGIVSGLAIAQAVNKATETLATCFKGTAEPNPTYPLMLWGDDSAGRLKQRNSDNTAWIDRGPLNAEAFGLAPAGHFRPYANSPADMTVKLFSGAVQYGATHTIKAIQTTPVFVAPTTNPRNDLVVIDQVTGDLSVVAGAEAAVPSDPAIPSGKIVVAMIPLVVGQIVITDGDIEDRRTYSFTAQKSFPRSGAINVSANTSASASQMGGIFRFTASGKTLTVPSSGLASGDTMVVQGGAYGGTLAMSGEELLIDEDGTTVDPLTIGVGDVVVIHYHGGSWYIVFRGRRKTVVGGMRSDADQTPTSGVDTKMTVSSVFTGNSAGLNFDDANNKITVSPGFGGLYLISMQCGYTNSSNAASIGTLKPYRNGIYVSVEHATLARVFATGVGAYSSNTFPMQLADGDYLEVYMNSSASGGSFPAIYNKLTLTRIGD